MTCTAARARSIRWRMWSVKYVPRSRKLDARSSTRTRADVQSAERRCILASLPRAQESASQPTNRGRVHLDRPPHQFSRSPGRAMGSRGARGAPARPCTQWAVAATPPIRTAPPPFPPSSPSRELSRSTRLWLCAGTTISTARTVQVRPRARRSRRRHEWRRRSPPAPRGPCVRSCFAVSISAAGCIEPPSVPVFLTCVHGVHAWASVCAARHAACPTTQHVHRRRCRAHAGACVFNESLGGWSLLRETTLRGS